MEHLLCATAEAPHYEGFLLFGGQPFLAFSQASETFHYQPVRHYYAIPLSAPDTSFLFAVLEKIVPDQIDPQSVRWSHVDMEPE